MLRVFFILLFAVAFTPSKAQYSFPLHPNGVYWSTLECDSVDNCEVQFCAYDLVNNICGYDYSLGFITPSNEFAYFRTDNEKVYIRNNVSCAYKEYLMYDFSLQIGDSTYCGYNINQTVNDTTRFWVTNITTEQFVGIDRKVLHVNYFTDPPNNTVISNMRWIQGIGSDVNPFYPMDCLPPFCNKTQELVCYDSTSTQLFLGQNFLDCSGTLNSIDDPTSDFSVTIGPNPFKNQASIYFDRATTATVTIYNMAGQEIQKRWMIREQSIQIGNSLSKGVYMLEIYSKDAKISKKLIKL
jgi:hypothetical protein